MHVIAGGGATGLMLGQTGDGAHRVPQIAGRERPCQRQAVRTTASGASGRTGLQRCHEGMRVAGVVFLFVAYACDSKPCAEVICPTVPAVPSLTIHVTDQRGLPLTAKVTISNLSDPSGPIMVATSCTAASDGSVTCLLFLYGTCHYELDVAAAGYATQHVAVDMPVWKVDP